MLQQVNIVFYSQLTESVKCLFVPGEEIRLRLAFSITSFLIPHQPQRKLGGERL